MSEKRVKAWAVVDSKTGKPIRYSSQHYQDRYDIYHRRADAKKVACEEFGERVVPVTIIVEEK